MTKYRIGCTVRSQDRSDHWPNWPRT